jgi:hypothetical protein
LPVFLADNHGESFGWVAGTLDLDAEHLLVLVDAHSDASACERSEEIRERLRRVASVEERGKRVEEWRRSGRIQAFNWIEPLMPRPFGRVVWIAAGELAPGRAREMGREAVSLCDGRLEFEPRSAGRMAERWEVADLKGLAELDPGVRPVVLSLDLDFFAGMEAGEAARVMEEIWIEAMDWPGLTGVCASVSRPWAGSDAEAERLVEEFVSLVSRTRGARLEIDTSIDDRPDRSERALKAGAADLPRWDFHAGGVQVKALVAGMGERCKLVDRERDVREWVSEKSPAKIIAEGLERDIDGVWRAGVEAAPVLRVRGGGDGGRARWWMLEPARDAYDLLPETGLGKGFAESPGRWIYERRRSLGETADFALAPGRWAQGAGRYRIAAEVECGDGWYPLLPVDLRLVEKSGFRRALSECRRMPYVFGVAGVVDGGSSGVECGWGSDCSNLLIHAWRRCGRRLAWGDPGRLRAQLRRLEEDEFAKNTEDWIERGVAVDLGRHVAALWEDRDPLGRVGAEDVLLHHLGGRPELVKLGELARGRPTHTLWTPAAEGDAVIRFAGDVVLAGAERAVVAGFERGDADLFVANLEGVPSMKRPARPPRYDLRFGPERLDWLKERGVSAVCLANNHCGDAGEKGLLEALTELERREIGCFGAGHDAAAACRPWIAKAGDCELAFFGVSIVPTMEAGEGAGAAVLPGHQAWFEKELENVRQRGARIVVMMHGGDEYRREVNDDQRRWARWWIEHGAEVVVGSGPHVVQRSERHAGALIHHSLGNAVYPVELKGADGGRVVEMEIGDTAAPE